MNQTGKLFLIWAAIFAALVLSIQYWANDIFNPNARIATTTADGVKQITLDRDRRGHYLASGKINNIPVRFFLDTGATAVAIPSKIAEKLNLTRGYSYTVQTANGDADAFHTVLDSVSLGDLVVENVAGAITPSMGGDEILLGMSFLKHLDFAQKNGQLILSIPE